MKTQNLPTPPSSLPPRVVAELQTNAIRIRAAVCALRLWERILTEQDRSRLGGELDPVWRQYGTAGIWMKLRGVSQPRAIADVAHALNLIDPSTYQWLLRELGEIHDDPDQAIQAAVATGALVLIERPRAAYWAGALIELDWDRRPALWDFLWELSRQAKAGQPLDHTLFRSSQDHEVVTKQKSRLVNQPGFPADLADHIQATGRYTQQLDLPPAQIRLFEVVCGETVRERSA